MLVFDFIHIRPSDLFEQFQLIVGIVDVLHQGVQCRKSNDFIVVDQLVMSSLISEDPVVLVLVVLVSYIDTRNKCVSWSCALACCVALQLQYIMFSS